MSNKQNIGYNSQDFLSVLKYMKKEHAQDFLTWNDKMNSLLGDYAPDLKAERAVFKRMMQRGILKKFAQADGQDTDKKNRVFKECQSLPEMITMFLATLELIKVHEVEVEQEENFGDIVLRSVS